MLMPAGAIEKDFQWASGLPCATSACSAATLVVNFPAFPRSAARSKQRSAIMDGRDLALCNLQRTFLSWHLRTSEKDASDDCIH